MPVAKSTGLAALIASADKKFNMTVGPLNQIAQPVNAITTGNIAIDHITGVGGLPLGRSVELAGPPSSGKTTTALQTAANLQQIIVAGGYAPFGIKPSDHVLYLDYEYTIDEQYSKMLGLDVNHDSFLLTQPDTLEDGANFAIKAIETGEVRLLVWDSVASMLPSAKAEAEIGKSLPAVQAKLMSDLGQRLNPILSEYNVLNIWVNHLKEQMAMGGYQRPGAGPRMSTPGGVALKFFASVRIEFRQIRQIKETVKDPITLEPKEVPIATDVSVKVTKNKVGPPFRTADVRVRFGRGFDNFYTALQILVSHKQIVYGAGVWKFHRLEAQGLAPEWMPRQKSGTMPPYIKGEKSLFLAADKFPEWRDGLIALAKKILDETGSDSEEILDETESETLEEVLAEEGV